MHAYVLSENSCLCLGAAEDEALEPREQVCMIPASAGSVLR